MAESIFAVLDTCSTETSVPAAGKDDNGKTIMVAHDLPRELFPTSEQFESGEQLLEWSEEIGATHAILQRGIQKFLIEARATFKGCKKDDVWSQGYGQANVDEMEWKAIQRPNQGGNNKAIATAVLKETVTNMQLMIDVAGLDVAKISEVLLDKFDNDGAIVEAIMVQLNFA